MSNVKSIKIEILSGNCGNMSETEIEAYEQAVIDRLCELYPGAEVETEIVNAGGTGRAPLVDGHRYSEEADTVARVVQDVWDSGEF